MSTEKKYIIEIATSDFATTKSAVEGGADRIELCANLAEGGTTPSRFKHLILTESGRYRRLTPRELERLNGFPDDWTDTGMPDGRRAFMMGNALVVGLVERVAHSLVVDVAPPVVVADRTAAAS